MSTYDSRANESGPTTTDAPSDETAFLSQIVSGSLHFEKLPDFDVWMSVGWSSQDTIERVACGEVA